MRDVTFAEWYAEAQKRGWRLPAGADHLIKKQETELCLQARRSQRLIERYSELEDKAFKRGTLHGSVATIVPISSPISFSNSSLKPNMPYTFKDTADLSIHPLAKLKPEWATDSASFTCLVNDVRERGIIIPLLIDREGRIIDGKMIFRVAKQLQLAQVPCMEVADDHIPAAIIGSLVQRKHYTKSALAYLTYPLMQPAYEAARKRRIENLKKANDLPKSPLETSGTVDAFAESCGIGRNLFFEAKKVHKLFAKDADFKAAMEPRILAEPIGGEHENKRPMGLGAVIAGWAGREATLNGDREDRQQLELFTDGLDKLQKRFGYWDQFSGSQKIKARAVIRETVAAMPEDLREEWLTAIKQANKGQAQAA